MYILIMIVYWSVLMSHCDGKEHIQDNQFEGFLLLLLAFCYKSRCLIVYHFTNSAQMGLTIDCNYFMGRYMVNAKNSKQ